MFCHNTQHARKRNPAATTARNLGPSTSIHRLSHPSSQSETRQPQQGRPAAEHRRLSCARSLAMLLSRMSLPQYLSQSFDIRPNACHKLETRCSTPDLSLGTTVDLSPPRQDSQRPSKGVTSGGLAGEAVGGHHSKATADSQQTVTPS
jgi:hypothetical protein